MVTILFGDCEEGADGCLLNTEVLLCSEAPNPQVHDLCFCVLKFQNVTS
jgi:hypothetical protein